MTKTLNIIAAKITSFTVFAWPTISSRSKGIPRLRKINDVVSQEKVPCLNRFILGREEESLFVTLIDTSVTVVVNKHLSAMMECLKCMAMAVQVIVCSMMTKFGPAPKFNPSIFIYHEAIFFSQWLLTFSKIMQEK